MPETTSVEIIAGTNCREILIGLLLWSSVRFGCGYADLKRKARRAAVPARKHHEKSMPFLRCADTLAWTDQVIPFVRILVGAQILGRDLGNVVLGIQPLAAEQRDEHVCNDDKPQ